MKHKSDDNPNRWQFFTNRLVPLVWAGVSATHLADATQARGVEAAIESRCPSIKDKLVLRRNRRIATNARQQQSILGKKKTLFCSPFSVFYNSNSSSRRNLPLLTLNLMDCDVETISGTSKKFCLQQGRLKGARGQRSLGLSPLTVLRCLSCHPWLYVGNA